MSQPLSGGDITNTITAVLIFDAAATILQLYYVMVCHHCHPSVDKMVSVLQLWLAHPSEMLTQ
jgi:hypothetical protein